MSKRPLNQFLFILALLLLVNTAGCFKKALPIYYYTLDSAGLQTVSPSAAVPNILVGPIRIASFLNQRQLVKNHSAHSVYLLEQHRWAGDLQELLSNVMISNLSKSLGSDSVYPFPSAQQLDGLQLEINFLHFEEDTDGNALLEARWKLVTTADNSTFYNHTARYQVPPKTKGYDALAGALSQGLAMLAEEIAEQIRMFKK